MTPSQAAPRFEQAIQEAENLLLCFDRLNLQSAGTELEVLKRAGLLMAMTAWQNYVEDRLQEAVNARWAEAADDGLARFVQSGLDEAIGYPQAPSAEKTLQMFRELARRDLLPHWHWDGVDAQAAGEKLNGYLVLQGNVQRRRPVHVEGPARAHPVARDDLQGALHFLRALVEATERALAPA